MSQPQSHKARAHDLQLFHGIVQNIANHPAYTSRLPHREQKQLVDTPLKKDLSPLEQVYLRAHAARQSAYADTYAAADEAVQAELPAYPDNEAERLWSAQSVWASQHRKALAAEVTTPRFASHFRDQVVHRTGHWLGLEAESFLAAEHQPHLYARVGALALHKEFKGEGFPMIVLDDVLGTSLDTTQVSAVRDVLTNDGVLVGDTYALQVNPYAVGQLNAQEIYVPPRRDTVVPLHQ